MTKTPSLLERLDAYLKWQETPVFKLCERCQGKGYHHGFGEHGRDPDWCDECAGNGEQPTEPGAWSSDDLLRDCRDALAAKDRDLVQLNAVLEACELAATGVGVSDFMESFPPVRAIVEALAAKDAELARLRMLDTHCVKCGEMFRNHCDLDEPGVDHAAGCALMHHEFVARSAEQE